MGDEVSRLRSHQLVGPATMMYIVIAGGRAVGSIRRRYGGREMMAKGMAVVRNVSMLVSLRRHRTRIQFP